MICVSSKVTKAVSVDSDDVVAFKRLVELEVELDLRVVATDTKGDFVEKLKEAGF